MYVKFIDSTHVENAPRVLHDETRTIINPTEAILLEHGYKPLVETDCPCEQGYWYAIEYVEDDDQITKTWVAHEMEVIEEETEPTEMESEDDVVQE